jgi:bilirubin oxidase
MRTRIAKLKLKVLIIVFFTGLGFSTNAQQNLLIPDTLSGNNFSLFIDDHEMQFFPGTPTGTMGVNGPILGPTLIMQQGDEVNIEVINQLEDSTTMHWHGMHVPAAFDGGPHTVIAPGTTWNPFFTVLDKAGTYWYHPHLHTKTDKHVSKGIAGLIIVRDAEEAALELPRTYGVDDFPVVIQTKGFDDNNQILVHSNSDDVVMVNATTEPVLDLPAQVVRLRVLNGSSQRIFQLGLSNNAMFYQIASDGGLLAETNTVNRLRISPGERAEILLNLTNMSSSNIQLMSYASELPNGFYGATNPGMMPMMTLDGYNPNPMNGNDFVIMDIQVTEATANPVTTIPDDLATLNPIPESQASTTRSLTFTPEMMGPNALNGKFLINGQSFEMNTINYTIPLDNIEIWSLTNQSPMAHPFHIHDVQFFVLDRNGTAPPASEAGRKDVILVEPMETVRFIAQFSTYADEEVPFMYHCHMLLHEDDGMMGQFLVVDESTGMVEPHEDLQKLWVSPNPAHDRITISSQRGPIEKLTIYSLRGKLLLQTTMQPASNKTILDISTMESGVFIIEAIGTTWKATEKLIIR